MLEGAHIEAPLVQVPGLVPCGLELSSLVQFALAALLIAPFRDLRISYNKLVWATRGKVDGDDHLGLIADAKGN